MYFYLVVWLQATVRDLQAALHARIDFLKLLHFRVYGVMIANKAILLFLNFLVWHFPLNPTPFSVVVSVVIFDELNFSFHSLVPRFLNAFRR